MPPTWRRPIRFRSALDAEAEVAIPAIRPAAATAAVLVLILALTVAIAGAEAPGGSGSGPSGSGAVNAGSPAAPSPLASGGVAHRPHEIFGFLPYWSMADWTDGYLRYDLLTTIAFFGVGVRDNGTLLTSGPGYTAFMSDRATTIIDHAHAAGVRVVITFESFGVTHNHKFLGDAKARQKFVTQALTLIAARGIDGANLDVEEMAGADRPGFGLLVGALSTALHAADPNSEISVATNGNVSGARMAKVALAAGADRAFLMGYAYRVGSTITTGSIAPFTGVGTALDLIESLDLYAADGVPADRIILGLPYYGMTWPTTSADLHAARQPDKAGFGRGRAFRPSTLTASGPPAGSTLDHDPIEGAARYTWYDPRKATWYQTYFDDPSTLAPKENITVERGLAGVGIWALGDDYGQPGYWETIAATLGEGPPYVPPTDAPSPPPAASPTGPATPTGSASPGASGGPSGQPSAAP